MFGAIVASSANYGVQQIPTDAAYWVNWTLPANGFSLETKAALGPGVWTSPTMTGWEVAGFHHVLFRQSDLPGSQLRLLPLDQTCGHAVAGSAAGRDQRAEHDYRQDRHARPANARGPS